MLRRRSDLVTLFVCLFVASFSLTLLASYNNMATSDRARLAAGFSQASFNHLVDWRRGSGGLSGTVTGTKPTPQSRVTSVVFQAYNVSDKHLATIKKVLAMTPDSTVKNKNSKQQPGEKGVELPAFIIGNRSLCDGVDILVYVQSKVEKFMARRNIRRTWAARNVFTTLKLKTMFVLGKPEEIDDQIKINNEQLLHGDIIEGDFVDSFYNLSLKSVIAMHWISHNCRDVKYVIKADDDMFINTFRVVERVLPGLTHNTIACHVVKAGTSPIVRDKRSKWYIPSHIFPNETHLPEFCSGFAVLMTSRLVSDLYSQVHSSPLIHVDDVYMFGQLTRSLGNVKLLDLRANFTLSEGKGLDSYRGGSQEILAVNVRGSAAMEELWGWTLMKLSPWARDNSKVNTPGMVWASS